MKKSSFLTVIAFCAMLFSCMPEELLQPDEQFRNTDTLSTKATISTTVADILDLEIGKDGTVTNKASSGLIVEDVTGSNKTVYFNEELCRYVIKLNNTLGANNVNNSFYKVSYKNNGTVKSALTTAFTIECVLRVDENAKIPSVEFKPISWTHGLGSGLYFNKDDGFFRFQVSKALKQYVAVDTGQTVSPGQFYHVVATFDGSWLYYYINGEPVGERKYDGTCSLPSDTNLQWIGIGGSVASEKAINAAFKGDIALARIYGKCIEKDGVSAIYNQFVAESTMAAAVVSTTTSTATVAWTIDSSKKNYLKKIPSSTNVSFEEDAKKNYLVSLHKLANCTDSPVISWELEGVKIFKSYPPRFCFSGLTPNTKYYFMVKNLSNGKKLSNGIAFATKAKDNIAVSSKKAGIKDYLLYQSFDNLIYGGDISTFSAGYSRTDRGKLTSLKRASGAEPNKVDSNYYLVDASTEVFLFTTLNGVKKELNVDDWYQLSSDGTSSTVCARPGYVKVGTSKVPGAIVTPCLSGLSEKSSLIKISFRACPFNSTDSKNIKVGILKEDDEKGGYSIDSSSGIITGGYKKGQFSKFSLETSQGNWKEYTVYLAGVNNRSRVFIGGAEDVGNDNRFLIDDIKIQYRILGATRFGQITDSAGGVQGIRVSDGIRFCTTDDEGYWGLYQDTTATHIVYQNPADREMYTENNYPAFWKKIVKGTFRYDMKVGEKIPKENVWELIVMADPQIHQELKSGPDLYTQCMPRFRKVVVPDIAEFATNHSTRKDKKAYGMVLGDISWNSDSDNAKKVRAAMGADKTNTFWYTVPGNHDWFPEDKSREPKGDMYRDAFGPMMYSFDRGDVHVIGINNIQVLDKSHQPDKGEGYETGFSEKEYNWIKEDLRLVPKDKCVILCCHAPIKYKETKYYADKVLDELSAFANPLVFSGHKHYNQVIPGNETDGKDGIVRVYTHAAVMGNLWRLKLCADGSPAGYTVYKFNGNSIEDVNYKPVGHSTDLRLTIYRGGDEKNKQTIVSSYGYKRSNKYVYVNLFFGNNEKQSKNNTKTYHVFIRQNGDQKEIYRLTKKRWEESFNPIDEVCRRVKPSVVNSDAIIANPDYYREFNGKTYMRNDFDWGYLYWALEPHENYPIDDRDTGETWSGAPENICYTQLCYHMWAGEIDDPTGDFDIVVKTPYGNTYVYQGNAMTTQIGSDVSFAMVNWGKK